MEMQINYFYLHSGDRCSVPNPFLPLLVQPIFSFSFPIASMHFVLEILPWMNYNILLVSTQDNELNDIMDFFLYLYHYASF